MSDNLAEIDVNRPRNFSQEFEGKIFFNREAPQIAEIFSVTEGEAIGDFRNLLTFVRETFEQYPEEQGDFASSFPAFCENVRFIGHQEFNQAIDAIANRWLELAKKNYVFLYQARARSERWMAIQVFKKIEEKLIALPPEEAQDLAEKIHFSAGLSKLAQKIVSEKIENWRVIALDDVRISGSRSGGLAYDVIRAFKKNGLDEEVTISRMEIDLVATRDDNPCLIDGRPIPIYSHFIVPSYKNAPFGKCSFTGWWRSTDYGFGSYLDELIVRVKNIKGDIDRIKKEIIDEHGEEILEDDEGYKKILRKKIQEVEEIKLPALARVVPPYETDIKGKYLDSQLQEDWERIQEKWEMKE